MLACPDRPVKGQAIVCFFVPRGESGDDIAAALSEAVVEGLGTPFRPQRVVPVPDLPKTRNMKVMRRVLRAVWCGEPPGDLSSLVNPQCIADIETARDD